MAGIKFLILTLLGLGVVQHTTASACPKEKLDACWATLDAGGYNLRNQGPVPFIPEGLLSGQCQQFADFSACLDDCRYKLNSPTTNRFLYEPYEAIAKYICSDRTIYSHFENTIGFGRPSRQSAWWSCHQDFDFENLNENYEVACSKMETYVSCVVAVATEANIEGGETYVRDMTLHSMTELEEYYECNLPNPRRPLGGYSAAGITGTNRWLHVLALLLFLIHSVI